jgi:hypothetical protein
MWESPASMKLTNEIPSTFPMDGCMGKVYVRDTSLELSEGKRDRDTKEYSPSNSRARNLILFLFA